MKYVFEKDVDLCGWEKLPYAIRDRRKGNIPIITWIDEHLFDLLKLCNGINDFDLLFFSDKDREILKKIRKKGIIKACKKESDAKEVEYTLYNNRYINHVLWSITGRCNAKCKHCYMSAPDAKYGEMSHEEVFKIIDELANAGVANVSLTGGECLVRSDFLEIIDRLIEKKIYINEIYTNGFLVNEKLLTALKDRNICPGFNISFDGVGFHDWMRGINGAEKMASDAFKLCHRFGFPISCEMVIFKKNLHSIRETVNYLSKLGVKSIKIAPVTKSEFWEKYGEKEELTIKEVFSAYLDYIPYYYIDGKPMNVMLGGFFAGRSKSNNYFIPFYKNATELDTTCACNHARLIMYLAADGRALPCMSLSSLDIQSKFPRIQDIGLSKCLSDSFYMEFIDKTAKDIIDHNPKCAECEYKANCYGGCRAAAVVLSDDLLGIDACACEFFKGGYIDKIKEVIKKVAPNEKYVF